MPELYLFGGPNGAGKTTTSLKVLEELSCRHFVNADAIASGLEPLAGEDISFRAGVLMMKRVREFAESGVDFASESTLAARAWVPLIRRCQTRGYTFNLIYVWLPSADLAVERVNARVRAGGHSIPEDTIRRRYEAGLQNLRELYLPLANAWKVYDNSRPRRILVAHGGASCDTKVLQAAQWRAIAGDETV